MSGAGNSRVLALCADDFGLAPGLSRGIARLAAARRLTAISCITNSPHWPDASGWLQGLPDTVDVGLHLNFTEGRPLSPRLARLWPRRVGQWGDYVFAKPPTRKNQMRRKQ